MRITHQDMIDLASNPADALRVVEAADRLRRLVDQGLGVRPLSTEEQRICEALSQLATALDPRYWRAHRATRDALASAVSS